MNNETDKQAFELFDGQKRHRFDLPAGNILAYQQLEKPEPLSDIGAALLQRLHNPIASAGLQEQIKAGMNVLLICDDYSRPTPTHLLLLPLLGELNRLGIPDKDIKILVAAGHHRQMSQAEKTAKYGKEAVERIEILHHFSEDTDNQVCLGRSSQGIDVWVNKLAVDADFTIGIGITEVHPWAGFAGGGKIINPGIAGKLTIDQTHLLPILPNVNIGKSLENPFWQTSCESAEMLPLNMLINCLLDIDEHVIELAVGQTRQAHLWLIEQFLKVNELVFCEPADIVITTAYPKYPYWGQVVISLYNSARIIKPGGVRIILASCEEGLGDCEHETDFYYRSLSQKHKSPRYYWDNWLGEGNCDSRNTCAVYRHLCDAELSDGVIVTDNLPTGLVNQPVYRSIDEALEYAFGKCGKDARIAIYDKGAMVLVSLKS